MAKIANQTAYPIITPTIRDYFIVTDVEDNNNTKNVSIPNSVKAANTTVNF